MVLSVCAWWNFHLFSRTFPFIFHWKESRGNFTERTTNSIQFVVCKRSAFRPRYELSVTRLVAAQNKFQTETRIWCLSIRRPNNTDFGFESVWLVSFFLILVRFVWLKVRLSRAEYCFEWKRRSAFGSTAFPTEWNRIWDRSGFPDRDWVAF